MTDLAIRELILASAGSGKTYRISSRIIALLAAGESPSTIFASTFTRKAAGEILDRVLLRLAEAALDPEAANALEEGSDPEQWRTVLDRTVRELHRLDIGTLDSFFVRVVRSFANELGLVPGWTLADERAGDLLRRDAIEQLLTRQDPGPLIETIRAMQGDQVRSTVQRSLDDQIDHVLRIHRSLSTDDADPGWEAMSAVVAPRPDDFVDRCRRLADDLTGMPVPTNKGGGPNANWQKAILSLAEEVRDRNWESMLNSGLATKLLEADADEVPTYYGKPIEGPLRSAIEDALELARIDLGAGLATRGRALGELAAIYVDTWNDRVRESGLLRFEDVTLLASDALRDEEREGAAGEALFYRMGRRSRHLLLDEFQDTSLPQWRALAPVVDGLWSGEGTASVVADPKQSIYGWRGAAPEVVEAVGTRYGLTPETIAKSYRSSQIVLDAVNQVFGRVEDAWPFEDDAAAQDVAAGWGRAFEPHTAHWTDRPGRVRVRVGPELEGRRDRKSQPAYFRWVAARVAELHRELPGRSIGVLMRTNDNVGRMIFELGRIDVPASEEGGTRLVDSAPVVSLLALLRLADHPGDLLARRHVAETPVGPMIGLTDPMDDGSAVRTSRRVRRLLLEEGYGPTLAEWVRALRPDCDAREALRAERLVELAYRFDRALRGSALRVGEFVQLAEVERAESPGDEPVRVMTVHGSKGLEFDVVVLPELHAASLTGGRTSGPIARRSDPVGPVTHAFPRISSKIAPLFTGVPELQEGLAQERAAGLRDSLGMLYVAMTRARNVLELIVPADGEKIGKSRDHARLIRERLAADSLEAPVAEPGVLFDSSPTGDWPAEMIAPKPAAEVPGEAAAGPPAEAPGPAQLLGADALDLRTEGPRRRNLERRSPSSREGGSKVEVGFLLGLTDLSGSARDRGTFVHAGLEEVEWIENGLPSDARMREIAARETPSVPEATLTEWIGWLRSAMESEAIRAAVSRERAVAEAGGDPGSGEPTLRVEFEVPFLVRDGDALAEGFIDRLVLTERGGEVVAADILDWKTDRIEPGDAAALDDRAEHYRPQIEAYRRAVSRLFGLDPERIRGRLLFLAVGAVREV